MIPSAEMNFDLFEFLKLCWFWVLAEEIRSGQRGKFSIVYPDGRVVDLTTSSS